MTSPPAIASAGRDYTLRTQRQLDEAFAGEGQGGTFFAPVFGFGASGQQAGHAVKVARTARILGLLAREGAGELLDVGAAEGYTADWARELFGARVAACDLSPEACRRGRELFGIPTFACTADNIPVADRAFDCVLCSEVIEHLADPVAAIAELMRVTGRTLILTSRETVHFQLERWLRVRLRDLDHPHAEINWWHPSDFPQLMGEGTEFRRQHRFAAPPDDDEKDMEKVVDWLRWSLAEVGLEREGLGGILIWRRPEAPMAQAKGLDLDALRPRLLAPRPLGRTASPGDDAWLMARLRSPRDRSPLARSGDGLVSATGDAFAIVRGVPDLVDPLANEATLPPWIDAKGAQKLRALFERKNVLPAGDERIPALTLLGAVEFVRDLRIGVPVGRAWRNFVHSTRFLRRHLSRNHEGWLVRGQGAAEIYKIVRGGKRLIPSVPAFQRLGYSFDEVIEVPLQWLDRFPAAEPLLPEKDSQP